MGILDALFDLVFGTSGFKPTSPEETAKMLQDLNKPKPLADFLRQEGIPLSFLQDPQRDLRTLTPGRSMALKSFGNLFGEPEATIVRSRHVPIVGPTAFGGEYYVYFGNPRRNSRPDLVISTDCLGDVVYAARNLRGYTPED